MTSAADCADHPDAPTDGDQCLGCVLERDRRLYFEDVAGPRHGPGVEVHR